MSSKTRTRIGVKSTALGYKITLVSTHTKSTNVVSSFSTPGQTIGMQEIHDDLTKYL